MRILFFINTYFQLIVAMQMKRTIYRSDEVTAVITDRSNNSIPVYQKLKVVGFFDETIYVEARSIIHSRTKSIKIKEFIDIVFDNDNRYSYYFDELHNKRFDAFAFFNLDMDMYGIYSLLSRENPQIQVLMYEEGVLSYENTPYDTAKFKFLRLCRRLMRKKNMTDNIIGFACFNPALCKNGLKTIQIPQINPQDQMFKNILKTIFDVTSLDIYSKYKYIFFESSYETDGKDIEETQVVLKIASIVGVDNILVKKHPRSTTRFYENHGFQIDTNSSVPFEVIQLCVDFSKSVFISTISGAAVSINTIVENPSKVVFIYPMTNYKKYPEIEDYIDRSVRKINDMKQNGSLRDVIYLEDYKKII